ncbi:MAG: MarR family transcriptional regulator [Syntrophomonadaceae bacterium]|nr:MarR family transcriptional regulator [Syntrophomonadaceae bacterium]
MDKNKMIDAVPYSMLSLAMRYVELNKRIHSYGTDTIIFHSEIHLISAIARNPEIHVKGLAELLGITSASVSEMLSKLLKKGLVRKEVDKDNLARVKLSLTTKGQLAHEEHMRYHDQLNRMVADELADATDEQIAFILEFCAHMCERLNNL